MEMACACRELDAMIHRSRWTRTLRALAAVLVCAATSAVGADEDTCKSARASLQEQLSEHFAGFQRANVLNLNTLKAISATGPGGESPGYECWATAMIWTANSDAPQTVRVIYTVFNLSGLPVDVSAVGIKYICGRAKQRDDLYSVCTR
jgi:hypothetical protein